MLAITHIKEEEDLEREVLVNSQGGTPFDSSSSSLNPLIPPLPSSQGIKDPEEIAQP